MLVAAGSYLYSHNERPRAVSDGSRAGQRPSEKEETREMLLWRLMGLTS